MQQIREFWATKNSYNSANGFALFCPPQFEMKGGIYNSVINLIPVFITYSRLWRKGRHSDSSRWTLWPWLIYSMASLAASMLDYSLGYYTIRRNTINNPLADVCISHTLGRAHQFPWHCRPIHRLAAPRAGDYLRYCVGLRENSNSFPPVRYAYKPFRPIASTDYEHFSYDKQISSSAWPSLSCLSYTSA
jgi:hypothetical protein